MCQHRTSLLSKIHICWVTQPKSNLSKTVQLLVMSIQLLVMKWNEMKTLILVENVYLPMLSNSSVTFLQQSFLSQLLLCSQSSVKSISSLGLYCLYSSAKQVNSLTQRTLAEGRWSISLFLFLSFLSLMGVDITFLNLKKNLLQLNYWGFFLCFSSASRLNFMKI